MSAAARTTGLTITNPLVLYRARLASKQIEHDPAQHRLAIHLGSLYERLKDYDPILEQNHRLNQLSSTLRVDGTSLGSPKYDVRKQDGPSRGMFANFVTPGKRDDKLALTRILTSHEEAVQMNSPKGLMLHGEVGRGASLADVSQLSN